MTQQNYSLASVEILRRAYDIATQSLKVTLAPGSKLYPEVDTFADLPSAITYSGAIYLVLQNTWVALIFNSHPAGLYKSNGTSWDYIGALPSLVADNVFKIYDDNNFTRQWAFNAGNISILNTRTLTMSDYDQDLTDPTFTTIDYKQTATPTSPDTGYNKLYFKSDGNIYSLTSSGIETKISGGSSGAISKTFSYYLDGTLETVTSASGTETLWYNGDGTLNSITGTGIYPNKAFSYTGGALVSVTVS